MPPKEEGIHLVKRSPVVDSDSAREHGPVAPEEEEVEERVDDHHGDRVRPAVVVVGDP